MEMRTDERIGQEKLLSSCPVSSDRCDYPLLDLTTQIHLRKLIRTIRLTGKLTKGIHIWFTEYAGKHESSSPL